VGSAYILPVYSDLGVADFQRREGAAEGLARLLRILPRKALPFVASNLVMSFSAKSHRKRNIHKMRLHDRVPDCE